jgi:hypothetical protein
MSSAKSSIATDIKSTGLTTTDTIGGSANAGNNSEWATFRDIAATEKRDVKLWNAVDDPAGAGAGAGADVDADEAFARAAVAAKLAKLFRLLKREGCEAVERS